MLKIITQTDPNAPRPVHPRAVRTHGFFGVPLVRQHMVVDQRWTPNSVTEEFKGVADLLSKRLIFKRLEWKANRKRYVRDFRKLRSQCRDGRTKLQMLLYGENTKNVRNYLINHKGMQRLYQNMPVDLVVDNSNQRTFVLRKERDRLRFRLNQLEQIYYTKLVERADIENRIKYENEFVLDEEIRSREFIKQIANSNVRLRAIKTINTTYKKMIQVLRHDSIFYDPILRSLSLDLEDQAKFIKHILYLGLPAISHFKKLSEEYRQLEDKSRKTLQAKLNWITNFRKNLPTSKRVSNSKTPAATNPDEPLAAPDVAGRYVRDTTSMMVLKNELETIETTIREVKFATLCSQAKEIFPRLKSQVENNEILHKRIENDMLGHQNLAAKKNRAEVLEDVLINNLTEDEITRLERIKALKADIEAEDKREANILEHMKNRADVYVLLRFTLWNLNDMLRNVDKTSNVYRIQYPNPDLKLPLLKFEMLNMHAVPPERYEENIDNLMHTTKRKLSKLMRAYKSDLPADALARNINEFHKKFVATVDDEDMGEGQVGPQMEEEDDLLAESKMFQNVPNRKQIKAQSAKLVEELSKKEE